jgi:anthranilate/para-aminobenzoate synthase component I
VFHQVGAVIGRLERASDVGICTGTGRAADNMSRRGVYPGSLGYFSTTGAADLSIVIQTVAVGPDEVSYGGGGAIIALSERDAELAETAVEVTPLLCLPDQEFPE